MTDISENKNGSGDMILEADRRPSHSSEEGTTLKYSFEEFVSKYLKDFSKFQWLMMLIMAIPCFAPSLHLMSWVFIGSTDIPTRCRGDLFNTTTHPCDCPNGYEFVTNDVTQNAITMFHIKCGSLQAMVQSSYYVGQMIGSLVLAHVSDKYGRKTAFVAATLIQFYCATWQMVPLGVYSYMLGRIGLGFAHYGLFSIPVLLALEFLSPSKRKWATFGAGSLFAVGQIILGLIAMLELKFLTFQFALFLPMMLLFVCAYLTSESARWLIAQNKFDEAEKVLKRVAKVNNSHLPENWTNLLVIEKHNPKQVVGVAALVKTPRLRVRTCAVIFLWPVVSMLYYGMSTKMDLFGGNKYLTFIFGAFVEIPANAAVTLLIDRMGRKRLTVSGLLLVFICMLLSMVLPPDTPTWIRIAQLVTARFAITTVYSTIYTYTPELFPTVLRARTVGIASFCARIGGISSSYIVLFLVQIYGSLVATIPFMILAFLAALDVLFLLPETAGTDLPQTIDDVERPTHRAAVETTQQPGELQPLADAEA